MAQCCCQVPQDVEEEARRSRSGAPLPFGFAAAIGWLLRLPRGRVPFRRRRELSVAPPVTGAFDRDHVGVVDHAIDPGCVLRIRLDGARARRPHDGHDARSPSSPPKPSPFDSLELRGAETIDDEYELTPKTEVAYLDAGGVGLARLRYEHDGGVAAIADESLRVLLQVPDHLGSTSLVIDRNSSELVEAGSYTASGAAETDHRPGKWKNFREDYRFTGKEDDLEAGIQYFGKRYLIPALGRWASPDPLAVHAPGQADLNLYAYVHGQLLRATDPLGLDGDANLRSYIRGVRTVNLYVGIADRMGKSGLDTTLVGYVLKNTSLSHGPMDSLGATTRDGSRLTLSTAAVERGSAYYVGGKVGNWGADSRTLASTALHEAMHAFYNHSQPSSPRIAGVQAAAEAHYNRLLKDVPGTKADSAYVLANEAVADYYAWRVNMVVSASVRLEGLNKRLAAGSIDRETWSHEVDVVRRGYNKDAERRNFGYWDQDAARPDKNEFEIAPATKEWVDQDVLKGAVKDDFDQTFKDKATPKAAE